MSSTIPLPPTTWHFPCGQVCIHPHTTDPFMTVMTAQVPEPKHPFGLSGHSPASSASTCCRQKRVRTVSAGELQKAQKLLPVLTLLEVLPVGQELEVGQFPLEPNTKSLNTHSGCHKTALLSCYVRPSGTHPALSVPARNGAGAKALPVLNVHELCSWCKSSKLDRSHCSGAACGRD